MSEMPFVGAAGGRRELMTDLTRALAPGSPEQLLALVRFYGLANLTTELGREAQDRLLMASVRASQVETGADGRVYRPRNDEVAVLFKCPLEAAIDILDRITTGLNELGSSRGVHVEAGVAILPDEADDPIGVLERADRRLLAGDREPDDALEARRARRTLSSESSQKLTAG
jgi:GGDEF domain-containing protein